MYPPSPDNYSPSSFCAVLCLHPLIASPPLLVLATTTGVVYHCVALTRDFDAGVDSDTQSQVSQWSTSSINKEDVQIGLHVFESIELEIGITNNAVSWGRNREWNRLVVILCYSLGVSIQEGPVQSVRLSSFADGGSHHPC